MKRGRANTNLLLEDSLTPESLFVTFVFFVVLSQFLLYIAPERISQPFRPLIVLILTVQVVRRGKFNLPVCNFALAMAIYQLLVWFFLFPAGGGIGQYLVLAFYFMMLFAVAGFPWNRRELQFILYVTFLATFVCALVFAFSNNMLDVSEHEIRFMGEEVNRNKNAYAFGFGIILGSAYLLYGKGRNRIIILLMMLLESYCLLYSRCRGAFLAVALSISVVIISRSIRSMRMNDPYAVLYLAGYIAALILIIFLIRNSAFSRLLDSENLSGRDDGIRYAIERFQEAPFAGKIFGNGILYETLGTEKNGVHLVYLSYLLESGVIGAALIITIFLTAMARVRGETQWSLFLFAFSRTFFEGMDYYIFIPLIIAVCMSNFERIYGQPCEVLLRR